MEKDKTKGEEDTRKNRVRIILTCKEVKKIEKVSKELITRAKGRGTDVKVIGPQRMPTKTLRITVRKSPCGEGTNTWDRFELRIYKRIIDLVCTTNDIREITSITIDPGVEVELTM